MRVPLLGFWLRLSVLGAGVLAAPAPASALPPVGPDRGFVDGANHHVGDAGFVARYGRAPTARDAERVRMATHLAWIRAELGARPATRPELAARRATLLGYLDDYSAHGTTPLNVDVPWRNPVFIDPLGQVCAVGYLIERDVGRATAEAIAAAHRFDYLEDIAREVPAVAAWIEGSGFTLGELASIQPGYMHPEIDNWELRPSTAEGPWKSTYGDGGALAEGRFHRGHPAGPWRFYHPSGALAAEGSFTRGVRTGEWRFYDDVVPGTSAAAAADARPRLVARGRFDRHGGFAGRWRHYDATGRLAATTYDVAPGDSFGEHVIDVAPPSDPGVHLSIHIGNVAGDGSRVTLARVDGGERFAVSGERWDEDPRVIRDARGHALRRSDDGAWTRAACPVPALVRRAAATGSISAQHAAPDDVPCGRSEPVPAATAARLERLVRALEAPEPEAPRYLVALRGTVAAALARARDPEVAEDLTETAAEPTAEEPTDGEPTDDEPAPGLYTMLAAGLGWYVEPDHVDRLFELVFATLPDRVLDDGLPDDPDADGS